MAFQGDIYNLKIATPVAFPDEVTRGLLTGKTSDNKKYIFALSYILRALSNVTLTILPFDDVIDKIRDIFRSHDLKLEVDGKYCIQLKFCDTIMMNFGIGVSEGVYYSPPYTADEDVILSVVNPGNEMDGGDDKRFSLGGIEASIWIVTLVCLVSLSVLSARLFDRYVRAPLCANGNRLLMTLEYIWFYTSDLLLNAGDIFPRRFSAKLLLSGWLLGTTVLMKAYSGNLKSEMMVSETLRIDTLEDLKKSPGTRPAVYKEGYFAGYIEDSRQYSPMMDQLAKETFYYPLKNIMNISSLMGFFPNGSAHYVIMEASTVLKRLLTLDLQRSHLKKSARKVYFGKTSYMTSFASYIFNPGLPKRILHQIDYLTLRYLETGQEYYLTLHLDMKLRPFLAADAATQLNQSTAKTLRELSTIFTIWSYGMGVASLCFCGELLLDAIGRRLKSEKSTKRPFAF